MTLDTLILLSGVFIAVLPYLGLPNSWDSVLFSIAGAFVIALGIVVRRRGRFISMSRTIQESDFVEHAPRARADAVGHEIN